MITLKDLEEKYHFETGQEAKFHEREFNEFILEQYLKLLNDLQSVNKMNEDWIQACIEEEYIECAGTLKTEDNEQ